MSTQYFPPFVFVHFVASVIETHSCLQVVVGSIDPSAMLDVIYNSQPSYGRGSWANQSLEIRWYLGRWLGNHNTLAIH